MTDSDFVLDLAENPHPKMLAGAIRARADAEACGGACETFGDGYVRGTWAGYLAAMSDATGETPGAVIEWMDRNA